jgi:hypothetical protein
MPVHERKLAERANAELLRQIEESLVHSREVIAQINEILAHKRCYLGRVRAGAFGSSNFSSVGNAKWAS